MVLAGQWISILNVLLIIYIHHHSGIYKSEHSTPKRETHMAVSMWGMLEIFQIDATIFLCMTEVWTKPFYGLWRRILTSHFKFQSSDRVQHITLTYSAWLTMQYSRCLAIYISTSAYSSSQVRASRRYTIYHTQLPKAVCNIGTVGSGASVINALGIDCACTYTIVRSGIAARLRIYSSSRKR